MAKTERLQVRLTESELELLSVLAEDLGLDLSSTVRFLIREKSQDRGIVPAKPAKRKRRAPGS
jgi:hypothetical protein